MKILCGQLKLCALFFFEHTDGMECPIGLLWTSSNGNMSRIGSERIYTLEEFDEASCAVRLDLSKEHFIRKGCPLTFQWRGKMEKGGGVLILVCPNRLWVVMDDKQIYKKFSITILLLSARKHTIASEACSLQ